jgi:threonine dehydrogenase-like Zn-dependent dehydrogenase
VYRGLAPQHLPADETTLSSPDRFGSRCAGYACVGRVTHVGSPDDGPWIGRRVFAFHPHASCFVAALADLLPIPETVSNDQAVFFPNLETAVSLVQDGAPILGERVAIFGQGVVGLLTAMLVARYPGLTVVSVDPLPRAPAARRHRQPGSAGCPIPAQSPRRWAAVRRTAQPIWRMS